MVDHVAYSVPDVQDPDLAELFTRVLGWQEFEADEAYQQAFMRGQYTARWWCNGSETDVHIVEDPMLAPANRGLEHMCIKDVGDEAYERCLGSRLCHRASGSGRCWLVACGLRVEVHP